MSLIHSALARRVSDPVARALCYLLGPVSGAFFANVPTYNHIWSIRFHAIHSIVLSGASASLWLTLRGLAKISPWFLGTVLRELAFVTILASLLSWVALMATAYGGGRLVIVPFLHEMAVKLARRQPVWHFRYNQGPIPKAG